MYYLRVIARKVGKLDASAKCFNTIDLYCPIVCVVNLDEVGGVGFSLDFQLN